MPETMPGFLLLASLVLFTCSFFTGTIEAKEFKIPTPRRPQRLALRWTGVALFVMSMMIYLFAYSQTPGDVPPISSLQFHPGPPLPGGLMPGGRSSGGERDEKAERTPDDRPLGPGLEPHE